MDKIKEINLKNGRSSAVSLTGTEAAVMAGAARLVRHLHHRGIIGPLFFLGEPIVGVVSGAAGYCSELHLGSIFVSKTL